MEIIREQTNPFYNEQYSRNGGGYDQPHITIRDSQWICDITDTSCGEFGSRIKATLIIADNVYDCFYGSMVDNEYSTIPNIEVVTAILDAICAETGYSLPTEDDIDDEWTDKDEDDPD